MNRIDEVLNQVGLQIIERRLAGNFPPGYEDLVERDHDLQSRFLLVRIIRDTARVRHDLRETKRRSMEVHNRIEELLKEISVSILSKTLESDQLATQLSYQVIERTMLLDQVVVLCRDLEKRLAAIEQNS